MLESITRQSTKKELLIRDAAFPVGLILISLYSLGPIGMMLGYTCILGSVYFTMTQKGAQFGKWYMWACIAVIVLIATVQMNGTLAVVFAWMAPAVYFIALNVDKKKMQKVFGATSLIASLSIVAYFIAGKTHGTGGIVDSANYNIATGVILLGAVMAPKRWQWMLLTIAVPALLLSGSQEAIFGFIVLGIAIVARRDFGSRLIPVIVVGIVMLAVLLASHQPSILYERISNQLTESASVQELTNGRLDTYLKSLSDITLFGHGYNPIRVSYSEIHNVPLMVLYQLGILGLLAFLIMLGITLWKTKAKYMIIAYMALMIFDHFWWTQLAVWTWAIFGMAQREEGSDYIWRAKEAINVEVKKVESAT